MFIPVDEELMPVIQECLAIAYQTVEDEQTAELIKHVMLKLDESEIKAYGGAVKFVATEGECGLH
jgi:hypothetical protein